MDTQNTIYSGILFRGKPGKLRLTAEKIAFKPDDWEEGRYDSWRWTAIDKHQVTSEKAKNSLLKLISKDDTNKSVIFTTKNHKQLQALRTDVTDRIRFCRRTKQQRRMSTETIGIGEFTIASSRRSSDISFCTVAMNDLDMSSRSIGSGSLSNNSRRISWSIPNNVQGKAEYARRVSALENDDDTTASGKSWEGLLSSKRRPVILLDPKTDTNRTYGTTGVKSSIGTRNGKKGVKSSSNSSSWGRMIKNLVLWTLVLLSFNAVGQMGYFNGVVEKSTLSLEVLESSLSPLITPALEALEQVKPTIEDAYDVHLKPSLESIRPAVEDAYETHIKPSWESLEAYLFPAPVEAPVKRGLFGKKKVEL